MDDDGAAVHKGTGPPEMALDGREQSGFVHWYKSQIKPAQLIRFFDRKGFYSVHGEDALFVARQFYKTTAVVKHLGGSGDAGLSSVTLNRNLFEQVLRELLLEGTDYAVELWEGSGTSWKLSRAASPGRLAAFEEELFRGGIDMADTPVVVAVVLAMKEGVREVGLAYADVVARRLGVAQFVDDELLCSLEAVLVQLGAKEVLLPKEEASAADTSLHKRLAELIQRCGAMATLRPRALFNAKHLETDLAKLVKSGSVEHHADVLERQVARGALSAVMAFCELLAEGSGHNKWELGLYDSCQYMRLDAAAQRALNVFPTRLDASSSFSLYGLLNRGRTAMGKRRLRAWLKQPLVKLEEIEARHEVVAALVEDAELRERLRDSHLRGLPDVERLVRKLDGRKSCTLADLCGLYRASARLPLIEQALRDHAGPAAATLAVRFADPLAAAHEPEALLKFEELVEAAVDLDRVPDEFLVAPAYDERLQALAATKAVAETAISRLAADTAADLGLALDKQLKLEWHKVANTSTRCMRITQKDEKTVRSKLQAKYKLLGTTKDGCRFTSKALELQALRLQEASAAYEAVQRELVEQVVAVAHTFVEVWERVSALLAELDVLAGFADLAAHAPTPYTRPCMKASTYIKAGLGTGPAAAPSSKGGDGGEEVVLLGCRHPCVEAQEGVEFIKNDCVLRRGSSWFTIITGPNMGGKSTFIRQVGCCVLLAQVGCFVPADTAVISVRDAIFARVGAGDCQQRGVSTFMAEMLETAAILKSASPASLVIIDELGRGTSTYDGFGLAWAISEHLLEVVAAPTLFATHFHELTEITGTTGVSNLHVSTFMDPKTGKLTMLYQIRTGPCDQSFGIQVAESANFPASVIALAREKLAQLEGTEVACLKRAAGMKRKATDEAALPVADEQAAAMRARAFLAEFAALPLLQPGAEAQDPNNRAASGGKVSPQALQRALDLMRGLEAEAELNPALATLLATQA
ncbi:DNA mismatch repair protein [Haematococcus lacustris]